MIAVHRHIVAAMLLAAAWSVLSSSASAEDGGNVLCVRGVHSDSIVMAGTAQCGIYRTIDGGRSWTQTGLRTGAAYILTPDQRNALHWYAGTSLGLAATIDGGNTWWSIDSSFNAVSLAIASSGPRVLLATDGAGVRRTTDDGKSWSMIDSLTSYHITHLAVARTDTGLCFAAANDSVILVTTEKNQATWIRLPALPSTGAAAERIIALVCDTLSREGLTLAVGTTTGVFTYSFARNAWQRLMNGIPDGRIGSLGLIVYDTTSASRSYSLCASIVMRAASGTVSSRVYKISSASGVIHSTDAWNLIADEPIEMRDCFMPDRGENRAKIYLASSDGLRISYDGGTTWSRSVLAAYPIAVMPSEYLNAGITGPSETSTIALGFVNRGQTALNVRASGLDDAVNFSLVSADSLSVPADGAGALRIRFNPTAPGKYTARLTVQTNDPMASGQTMRIAGYSTGSAIAGNRTAVIDRSHGGMKDGSYAELSKALTRAGMSVIDTLPSSYRHGCALIILPAPLAWLSDSACSVLAQFAASGATIVAFANEKDSSRLVLNRLFGSSYWSPAMKSGLPMRFGTAQIAGIDGGTMTAVRSYVLRDASYLGHAWNFGCAASADVIITGSGADTLCTAVGVHRTDGATVQPVASAMLGAVTRVGSGKVIAMGDAQMWRSDFPANEQSGLWAADNFSAAMSIAETVENVRVNMPGTTGSELYTLFSVPFDLKDKSVAGVLAGFGKPDPYQWRLFGAWNEPTQTYAEYPSPGLMTIDRGAAYWLITKDNSTIEPGAADVSLIPEPFTVTLKPGFTLIGDPFTFPIDWSRFATAAGVEPTAWAYDGKEFKAVSTLRPYAGYFVCNPSDTERTVTLRPDSVIAATFEKAPSERGLHRRTCTVASGEGEWSLKISAGSGMYGDEDNYCGMLRSSADARDANDQSEPPVPPGPYVQFRFASTAGHLALASDYRSVNAAGAVWNCSVNASTPGAHVTLNLSPESAMPAGFSVWLLDQVEERMIDCTGEASYEFSMRGDESSRTLRIVVGGKAFVEQHADGVPLTPLSYALEQNFPNPWNPSTTIRFTIAHSATVKLELFNLLGQKVRTLVNAALPLGSYTQQWDGKDDQGRAVSSGIYLYRLVTPAFSQSKRMVLVR